MTLRELVEQAKRHAGRTRPEGFKTDGAAEAWEMADRWSRLLLSLDVEAVERCRRAEASEPLKKIYKRKTALLDIAAWSKDQRTLSAAVIAAIGGGE